jgi:2,4-dienoyl-CoA reductase-like NADH-dependent reductase (Old Yellow Enzyme family)/thioredoxin reductase
MFGGSSSVSIDSPASMWSQLSVADDSIIPYFKQFSARLHRHGAKLMCQLTHMGRRTRWDTENWFPTLAPSALREPAHHSFPKAMEDFDIERIQNDYAAAARRCKEGHLDGCEFVFTGHMTDQFICPITNKRTDQYGGSLENRMRFHLEMLAKARQQAGSDFLIGIRITGDDLLEGGNSMQECLEILKRFGASGYLDFMNVVGGNVFTHAALAVNVPSMSFPPAQFLYLASATRQITDLPIFYANNIKDLATASRAIEEGHCDMVGMTRGHLADPYIVRKLMEGRVDDIRQCVGANYCIDRIFMGGEALCIQNPATGREATMPHIVTKSTGPKRKVVVAGAGPAGLEAARVSAERGHDVVLFEKDTRSGGQVNIAAKAGWRENLSGIPRWLDSQVAKLGVDRRFGNEATAEKVMAESPDIVIVATGGRPNLSSVDGGPEFAVSTWDILTGKVAPGENVLLYDSQSQHQGPSTAEFLAKRGSLVEIVTYDRVVAEEMGAANFAVHYRELYKAGAIMTPNHEVTQVYREGNKLVAVLRNEYTGQEEERVIDQLVIEHGTLPVDELYFALKPHARNRGQMDLRAIVDGKPQTIETNPAGRFQLFRVGDAVASRNIHAAIYDSLRLCKDF